MKDKRNFSMLPRQLGYLCAFLVAMMFSMPAVAQNHAVGVGKNCPTATKVGDLASCTLTVTNRDQNGDTLTVNQFWDVIGDPVLFRNPVVGNLPITEVDPGVTCVEVPVSPAAPLGKVFPCSIPGLADIPVGTNPNGSNLSVVVSSEYIVPVGATDPLIDQGNVIVQDGCDVQPVGCNPGEQIQQFGAAVSLFVPSIDVTKIGTDVAKMGDEITYTIGFDDTTTGTGFPGFENCTGFDTLLGDLGAFTADVTRDFLYTVQDDDPDPLPNTVTITCGVIGFDNIVDNSASHNVDLIDPSIEVTKTGPELAKVGDTITYTIGFTDTGTGTLENCTGNDDVIGPLGAFDAGVPRNFDYTVEVGDPSPLVNIATITCDVAGFDNQASDNDTHSVVLIAPSIDVTKTGPDSAKVGDTVTYTIGFTNTGTGPLGACTGSDDVIGPLGAFDAGVPRNFDYTVQVGDPDPLVNIATITCDVLGFDNNASDNDTHSVDLIDPSIEVTKTGPELAKVGDTITYTIGFTDTGTGTLENCTGNDDVIGPLGAFDAGVPRNFDYTVEVGDPSPLVNIATITCDVAGFDNQASDNDTHSVVLIAPSIDVTKTGPDSAKVGDTVTYTIGFTNTGTGPLGACTGSDDVIGPLGAFDAGVPRNFDYTVQVGDPDPLVNIATITCDVLGFDNNASDNDTHSVDLIDPSIEVTKTGPELAKVGDTITYTIGFTDTGTGTLENCTGNDDVIGPLGAFDAGVPRNFDYTVQVGDPDPLVNIATITCDVAGFDNQASDNDTHSVDLIDPSIEVTKTGPELAKVGDTITYTIGFTDTGTGTLENCTGNDDVIGPLGAFDAGVPRNFDYTVQVGDPSPLVNIATITCDVAGFDNQASDNDTHSVDLIDPSIEVTKTGPEQAKVGDTITYTIGFTDTGTGTLENCTGNDDVIGPLGAFDAGVPRNFDYTVQVGDPSPLVNIATITCDVAGFDNQASDNDTHSVDLIDPSIEVTKTGPDSAKVGDTITYTIGFTDTGTGTLENCTGNDDVIGPLGAFDAGVPRNFDYTVQVGDPDPLVNIATITCDVAGFDNQASDNDTHSVDLIGPSIDVTKTGPDSAKVGDTITYTIGFTDTGTGTLENCTGNDDVIGPLGAFDAGVPRNFDYTVQAGDPDPLVNIATITCDVAGFDNQASDNDTHSVDLIDPSIEVTKEGPDSVKVGDTITYTIGFTDTGTGTLENCTGNDDVIGPLGAFDAGVPRNFDYTVQAGDPDPLVNIATITCDVAGFDNQASDNDTHSVDLIDPSVDLTKVCSPDPVRVGEIINWDITVNNTGDTDLNCLVNDTTAGITDEAVTVVAGGSEVVNASRIVESSDVPVISNTATVDCPIEGFDNSVNDEATADCEVIEVDEICRTPGFWGTHAGVEKRKSTNLTQMVIDAAGGTLVICGEDITNTLVPSNQSATEAICVSPSGEQRLQLARHLTAAALNCVISGGGADCTGVSIGDDWAMANDVCINGGNYSYWGGIIDDWNNSEVCHSRDLGDSDVFDGVEKLPGPAGSPRDCNKANKNDVTIFSPDP